MESPVGELSSPPPRDSRKAGYSAHVAPAGRAQPGLMGKGPANMHRKQLKSGAERRGRRTFLMLMDALLKGKLL